MDNNKDESNQNLNVAGAICALKANARFLGYDIRGMNRPNFIRFYAKNNLNEDIDDPFQWVVERIKDGFIKRKKKENKRFRFPNMKEDKYKRKIQCNKKNEKKPSNRKKHKNETDYDLFINSSYWKSVRRIVLSRDKNTCLMCGVTHMKGMHVHHKTYDNYRNEINHLDDLITLCHSCHDKLHGRINGENTLRII